MNCTAVNARGEPCGSALAGADELCPAHRPGGAEFMADIASRGGQATRVKLAGQAFTAEELPDLVTLEDAKRALDVVRKAVMSRRLSHSEGTAAAKTVDSWVKTETAAITARLVNELRAELDAKSEEIGALRKQLASRPRRVS